MSWGQLTTETLWSMAITLPDGQHGRLMNFHGGSGAAEGQLAVADMRDRADEEGIVWQPCLTPTTAGPRIGKW